MVPFKRALITHVLVNAKGDGDAAAEAEGKLRAEGRRRQGIALLQSAAMHGSAEAGGLLRAFSGGQVCVCV